MEGSAGMAFSSSLSGCSIPDKTPLQAASLQIAEVQDGPNYEEGTLFDHKVLSQVASLAQGDIRISWMLYTAQVASF